MSLRKTLFSISFILIGLLFSSCAEDEPATNVLGLDFWLGQYEITIINGLPVDCSVEFRQGEIISIEEDGRMTVTSTCDESILVSGDYTYENGLFELFIDWRQTEPDTPEFEFQFFQDQDGQIRMYRCISGGASCSVRLGQRL